MQVTQVSGSSPPPAPSKTTTSAPHLTPSKLPVDDEKDHRPLLHDNWFSWPPVPPVCCLHRTYRMSARKRKEPASDSKPYFCPERESMAAYSEVILQMLDSYLQQFSTMQRCLQTLLPWGKPVRAGLHQPDSLDCRKRGQPSFHFDSDDDDDDDEDFQVGQPPRKKLSIQRGKLKESEDVIAADTDSDTKVKAEAGVGEEEDHLIIDPGDGGDGAEDTAAYNAETQPLDSDNDLPDLHIVPDDTVDSSSSRRQNRQEKRKAVSPTPVSEDSQSSNSLLNEQGDLYSTQLPRRKRAVQMESDVATTRLKRQRKMEQPGGVKQDNGNSPEKLRPLGHKRKQVCSDDIDGKVYTVNVHEEEDDEVSFPQRRKVQVQRKRAGYVHISSSVEAREGRSAVVHPLTQSGHSTGGRSERVLPIRGVNDGKQKPSPVPSNVSSSCEMKSGSATEEESDDSVQYMEPPSCAVPALPAPKTRSQWAGQDDRQEGDQEDGDHGTVAAKPQAQEPLESEDSRAEELITCPLCNKQFASSVIERHASDCSLEIEEPQPPLHAAAPLSCLNSVPPTSQLRRRPLRGQIDRQEFVSSQCQTKADGSRGLKRQSESAKPKRQREEASCSTQEEWLHSYKIPRKVEGTARSKRLPSVAEEEDVTEEGHDDGDKDPPFRPTREDLQQEEEDKEEDGESASRRPKRPGSSRQQN